MDHPCMHLPPDHYIECEKFVPPIALVVSRCYDLQPHLLNNHTHTHTHTHTSACDAMLIFHLILVDGKPHSR